jgi:hypothetical protein
MLQNASTVSSAATAAQIPALIRSAGDLIPRATLENYLTQAWTAVIEIRHDPFDFATALSVLTAMYESPSISVRFDANSKSDVKRILRQDYCYRVEPQYHSDFAALLIAMAKLRGVDGIEHLIAQARLGFSVHYNGVYGAVLVAALAEQCTSSDQFVAEIIPVISAPDPRRSRQITAMVDQIIPWIDSEKREWAKGFLFQGVAVGIAQNVNLSKFFREIYKFLEFDEVKDLMLKAFGEPELEHNEWLLAAAIFRAYSEKKAELMEVFPVKTRPADGAYRDEYNAIYGRKSPFDDPDDEQFDPIN